MFELILHIIVEIWLVAARMAAFLLLGFLVAGLLSVYISPAWLERHLGGRGLGPVGKASLFGVPLPLCSCGVIPVAASLRRNGASRAATTAFLLSTPQTGVDSIMVTWTMLGPLFAVYRPVAAFFTGLLGGALVQAVDPDPHRMAIDGGPSATPGRADDGPSGGRIRAALTYGLVTLPGDIARALLVGIVIAGLLGAIVPPDFLSGYLGKGALSVALMMVAGIPIYVCATASVPLAASFIFMGATPGAALAFLIAGPATNAATITTVARVLGRRTMVAYLLTVAVSAFGGGLLLDWLVPRAADAIPLLSGMGHHHEGLGWFEHLCGVVLVIVMTRSWWLTRRAACCEDGSCATQDNASTRLQVAVEGMNCSHCSESVRRAVEGLAGVDRCQVDLEGGQATVIGTGVATEPVLRAIDELGFKSRLPETD